MSGIARANLEQAYVGSFYTIAGAGGDLNEWVEGYEKLLEEHEIGKPREWFISTGLDVNAFAGLDLVADRDQFQDDLTFLLFPLDGLDVGKLAMFKLMMRDRWFDDVIDNMRSLS